MKKNTQKLKNRKSPGLDDIANELLKYGGQDLVKQLTTFFQKILNSGTGPREWKKSITIPIFKKGDRKTPENYRGITLLSNVMKLFIESIFLEHIRINEEQQGFKKNRFTTDAIFMVRQLVEKATEFNKLVYMYFVNLTKAYDKIRLKDVIKALKEENR